MSDELIDITDMVPIDTSKVRQMPPTVFIRSDLDGLWFNGMARAILAPGPIAFRIRHRDGMVMVEYAPHADNTLRIDAKGFVYRRNLVASLLDAGYASEYTYTATVQSRALFFTPERRAIKDPNRTLLARERQRRAVLQKSRDSVDRIQRQRALLREPRYERVAADFTELLDGKKYSKTITSRRDSHPHAPRREAARRAAHALRNRGEKSPGALPRNRQTGTS